MKRALYTLLSLAITLSIPFATPQQASAQEVEPNTNVQFSQQILPGDCFDTVVQNPDGTVDLIAAWECDWMEAPDILAEANIQLPEESDGPALAASNQEGQVQNVQ